MMRKKMLSRKQCVFVIIILPMLIVPAMIIIGHADGRIDEVFVPPKRQSSLGSVAVRESMAAAKNVTLVAHKHVKPKPKPAKCFDVIWTGTCRDTCHSYNTQAKHGRRKQVMLKCDKPRAQIKTISTVKQKLVFKIPFQDTCLRKVVDKYCHDNKKVPNIIHYVWFGKTEFTFIHFLSFLSAYRIQNPCLIMLHADKLPVGKLWTYFLQICPKVVQVKRKQPKRVLQKKLVYVEHKADIAKLEALKEYGGIYVDTDQVILKPLDIFRNEDTTVGLDYSTQVSNSLILSKPNAPFIKLWYDTYRSYTKTDGNKHSQVIPYKLSKRHRELVTVVGPEFSAPNANQLSSIYARNIDWSHQFGMHLHLKLQARFYKDTLNFENIRGMNNTAGAVARWILYQNTDLCERSPVH